MRDLKKKTLTERVAAARRVVTKAKDDAEAAKAQTQVDSLIGDRTDHVGRTRRIAFAASVLLGLVVAALGVRALGVFIDMGEFQDLRAGQRFGFNCLDIVLTAGLIAGGSDALHQLVEAFSSGMERLKNNAQGEPGTQ